MAVPKAPAFSAGVWPVGTSHPKRLIVSQGNGRAFGASRTSGRLHIGVDAYANDGDPVVAVLDGVVVRNRGVFLQGTRADGSHYKVRRILVDHGGIIIGYGEVWPIDGLAEGQTVHRGETFAHVAKMRASSMMHCETWSKAPQPGRAGRWYRGEDPPAGLLDPTAMLLALAEDAKGSK